MAQTGNADRVPGAEGELSERVVRPDCADCRSRNSWVVSCDSYQFGRKTIFVFSGAQAEQVGGEDAAEAARKEGFSTKSIEQGEPLLWVCSKCKGK